MGASSGGDTDTCVAVLAATLGFESGPVGFDDARENESKLVRTPAFALESSGFAGVLTDGLLLPTDTVDPIPLTADTADFPPSVINGGLETEPR